MDHDPTRLYRLRDGIYAPDLLIAAVAEFDLFSWLARQGHPTLEQLCAGLGFHPRPADVLATYCAALGLIDRDGDELAVTALARQHLVAGSRYDLRPYFASLRERPACAELAEVLRTDRPAAWASAQSGGQHRDWSSRLGDVSFAERLTAAMDARGAFLAPALADALAHLPVSGVLDIAGGSGVYASALVDRRPDLRAAVFERSPVDLAVRTLLADRDRHQIAVITGDMFTDPLPSGFDLHLYSHVLHDWDQPRVGHLLAASYATLPPGGWLVDHDAHIDAEKRGPLPVAEYSVLLMHATPGKCWSVAEITQLAHQVGFVDIAHRLTAGDRSVILARKPD